MSKFEQNDVELTGVHPYTPENYEYPVEPEVRKQLEWFQDQKLGCLIHWGVYSQIGTLESWPLVDNCADRFRAEVDWIEDPAGAGADEFKQQWWDLYKSFNPVRYQPDVWADLIAEAGIKYCAMTTKHHDGFCMWDTQYTDFKITSPECPFSTHKYANVAKVFFDELRKKNISACAYFSKADWHHEDFWEDHGIGHYTDSWPTYKVAENPEKWAKFKEFTKNQIVEIIRDMGKIDILWLDAGWIRPLRGLGIDLEEILVEARKYNPGLISVDRVRGGQTENYITPEQKIPDNPLTVPWESCITLSSYWAYHYDDETYKTKRTIIHTLLEIVAKGGNYMMGVAIAPDGRIPRPAIERLQAMGAWMKKHGEGIYGTRIAAPYRTGDYAFTQKDGKLFAFRLYKEGYTEESRTEVIPYAPENLKAVKFLATGEELSYTAENGQILVTLPEGLERDEYADGFILELS